MKRPGWARLRLPGRFFVSGVGCLEKPVERYKHLTGEAVLSGCTITERRAHESFQWTRRSAVLLVRTC